MIDFEQAVLARSEQTPVLVDFWADWCGPCRVLGPVLEQMASETDQWELVKIDTEAHRELAQTYKIMSIPTVKLFHQRVIIAEFAGALPRAQIERWLAQHLPDPKQDALDSIMENWERQDPAKLQTSLKDFVARHPDMTLARLYYAQSLLATYPQEAEALLANIPMHSQWADRQTDLQNLLELIQTEAEGDEQLIASRNQARVALAQYDFEAAILHLLQMLMRDKNYANELARRALVALFRLLGLDHPLSRQYQRHFSMALY